MDIDTINSSNTRPTRGRNQNTRGGGRNTRGARTSGASRDTICYYCN